MKKSIIFLLFVIPLLCFAQNNLTRYYDYDEAGNRVLRKTIELNFAPIPPDSTSNSDSQPLEPLAPEYFAETIDRVEIKIYPNPTTENVTLEIYNMEQLQAGKFTLYSLTGQLLQEHPVHSTTTVVSMANLPKGAYMLKVKMNNKTEDWKIIKN